MASTLACSGSFHIVGGEKMKRVRRLLSCSSDVVDLAPLFSSGANRDATVREVGERLQHHGYLYAAGVACLPRAYIEEVYAFSEAAHALPAAVKRKFAATGVYTGPDAGVLEHSYDGTSVSAAHAWDYSRHGLTLGSDAVEYPSDDFVPFLDDLYSRQDKLGEALSLAMADYLGLERRAIADLARGPTGDFGTIRLMRYPSRAVQDAGIAPHTDFEAFTLMHMTAPGLQILKRDSTWLDVEVNDACFLVIVGDVIERLTNGLIKATPHRVSLNSEHGRYSIIRFHALAPDALIAPLPPFVTHDNPPRYSPVTMKKHMETTMRHLQAGQRSWDPDTQTSLSATRFYDTPA